MIEIINGNTQILHSGMKMLIKNVTLDKTVVREQFC